METDGKVEIDRRLPERVVTRVVVVLDFRIAGNHHAAKALAFDLLEFRDSLFDRPHRGLPDTEQTLR